MGIETALIAATVVSAGASIAGGIQANREAKAQSKFAKQQAGLAEQAAAQARIEAQEKMAESERQTQKLRSRQLVGFLKSGVLLEGTPLDVFEETELLGRQDVAALERQGNAQATQFQQQAFGYRRQGSAALQTGRARLVSGIGSAASTAMTGAYLRNQLY